MNRRIKALLVLTLLPLVQACLPDHLAGLDQKEVTAEFTKIGRGSIDLYSNRGSLSLSKSGYVRVRFGVNWLEDSSFTIIQDEHEATFQLPEELIDRDGKSLVVPGYKARQTVDVRFVETKTLSEYTSTKYRTRKPHKSSRKFYRDTYAKATYGVVADLFKRGAADEKLPRALWLGRLKITTLERDERIDSERITRAEYRRYTQR